MSFLADFRPSGPGGKVHKELIRTKIGEFPDMVDGERAI